MKLSKQQQQQIFLGLIVAGGAIYAYVNFCIKPTEEKRAKIEAELNDVLDKVEVMRRTANRLPALQKDYESLKLEVGKAEKKLPKEKNVEEILRIVTDESIKHRISVGSFSPGTEAQKNYFVEIPFGLNIKGNLHSLGKFLTILGQQERILSARNLNISYSLDTQKGHTIAGTFTLVGFMFKG